MPKIEDLPRWDIAEVLNTPERQAAYIRIALEEGSPEEIKDALNAVARARGMTETAKAAGITREGLYKALGEAGNPEFGTVLRIIRALGLQLTARRPTRRRASAG